MTYEEFEKRMAEKYPRYCGEHAHFGGFAIGEGWYLIIESLVSQIDHYTKWRRNMRAYDLRMQRAKNKGLGAMINFMSKGKEPTRWDIERAEEAMTKEISITDKVHWIRVNIPEEYCILNLPVHMYQLQVRNDLYLVLYYHFYPFDYVSPLFFWKL